MGSSTEDGAGDNAAAVSADPKASLKLLVSVGLWTAAKKERERIFSAAAAAVKDSKVEVSDNMVKALCKMLPAALHRQPDGGARKQGMAVVLALLSRGGEAAQQALSAALFDAFGPWRNLHPTVTSAKTAMAALVWTAAIFHKAR